MKKLLPLFLLLLAPIAWGTNPSIGQHVINTAALGTTSVTTTATGSATVTGSTFVVAFTAGGGASSGCSVSDNKSNTYTLVTPGSGSNPVEEVSDVAYIWLFQSVNGTGGAGHTATISCPDNIGSYEFLEVQNTPSSSPVDASASAYNATSPLSLPVTTMSGSLVIGFGMSATGHSDRPVTTAGTGFTGLDSYNDLIVNLGVGYLASATAAAHNPSFTHLGGNVAAFTIAYLPTGGGATCTHSGKTSGGALTVPTAGSTVVSLKAGTLGTVDCSTTQYLQPSLGNFGTS